MWCHWRRRPARPNAAPFVIVSPALRLQWLPLQLVMAGQWLACKLCALKFTTFLTEQGTNKWPRKSAQEKHVHVSVLFVNGAQLSNLQSGGRTGRKKEIYSRFSATGTISPKWTWKLAAVVMGPFSAARTCVCLHISTREWDEEKGKYVPSEWLESQRPSRVSRIGLAGNRSSFQCPRKTSVDLHRKKRSRKTQKRKTERVTRV